MHLLNLFTHVHHKYTAHIYKYFYNSHLLVCLWIVFRLPVKGRLLVVYVNEKEKNTPVISWTVSSGQVTLVKVSVKEVCLPLSQ